MIVHSSLVFSLIAAILPFASLAKQQAPDPPELQVIKYSWTKVRIGWERDPFGGAVESYDEMRIRARNEKRIDDAKKGGSAGEMDKVKREARADDANIASQRKKAPARYAFQYKLTIKNESKKTIRAIDWDYIFLDATSLNELGRQEFSNEQKISPGKTAELRIQIRKPPTQVVSVTSFDKSERSLFKEQVDVIRIEYSDGSVWERP
jgi:hypothetical protein